jgi:hypothetical protein
MSVPDKGLKSVQFPEQVFRRCTAIAATEGKNKCFTEIKIKQLFS